MISDYFGLDKEIVVILRAVLFVVVIVFVTSIAVKVVNLIMDKFFKKASRLLKIDVTHYTFIKHIVSALLYVIGLVSAIFVIPALRTLAISILAGAGVLAVVIGFASQHAFANIISGIFIAIFRPFRVGDRINVAGIGGIVEDITLRHTVIRTFENKRLIIPNSKISEETIENANFSDEKICRFVDFSISYDSNINKAMKIMADEASKHKSVLDNRDDKQKKNNEPVISVRVIGFGDSSVNLRAWVWAKNPSEAFMMGCDLNKSIKERFDKEGIEIPFPYRTIVYKDKKKIRK